MDLDKYLKMQRDEELSVINTVKDGLRLIGVRENLSNYGTDKILDLQKILSKRKKELESWS
jgi:hypothetical protein